MFSRRFFSSKQSSQTFYRWIVQPKTLPARRLLGGLAAGTILTCLVAEPMYERAQNRLTNVNVNALFMVQDTVLAASTSKASPTLLKQADDLFDEGQIKVPELYDLLKKANTELNGTDAEVLWRLSRAARLASKDDRFSKEEQKAFAFECFDSAKLACELDDENWAAHKWLAIGYSVKGDHTSTSEKLKNSYEIRKEFERALELNPTDATTTYLLGYWFFYFADMSWMLRSVASTIFGKPPEGSYEQALRLFEKAERLDPGFYKKNATYLAIVNQRLGNKEEARKWKEIALNMPTKTLDDEEAHKEAQSLSI